MGYTSLCHLIRYPQSLSSLMRRPSLLPLPLRDDGCQSRSLSRVGEKFGVENDANAGVDEVRRHAQVVHGQSAKL